MSHDEIVSHWQKGALDALEVAEMCLEAQKYEHALFSSHLAVEKALKASFIKQYDEAAPYTHDLNTIAESLSITFSEENIDTLREMSRLAVRSRYADHQWSQEQVSQANASFWFEKAKYFIDQLSL